MSKKNNNFFSKKVNSDVPLESSQGNSLNEYHDEKSNYIGLMEESNSNEFVGEVSSKGFSEEYISYYSQESEKIVPNTSIHNSLNEYHDEKSNYIGLMEESNSNEFVDDVLSNGFSEEYISYYSQESEKIIPNIDQGILLEDYFNTNPQSLDRFERYTTAEFFEKKDGCVFNRILDHRDPDVWKRDVVVLQPDRYNKCCPKADTTEVTPELNSKEELFNYFTPEFFKNGIKQFNEFIDKLIDKSENPLLYKVHWVKCSKNTTQENQNFLNYVQEVQNEWSNPTGQQLDIQVIREYAELRGIAENGVDDAKENWPNIVIEDTIDCSLPADLVNGVQGENLSSESSDDSRVSHISDNNTTDADTSIESCDNGIEINFNSMFEKLKIINKQITEDRANNRELFRKIARNRQQESYKNNLEIHTKLESQDNNELKISSNPENSINIDTNYKTDIEDIINLKDNTNVETFKTTNVVTDMNTFQINDKLDCEANSDLITTKVNAQGNIKIESFDDLTIIVDKVHIAVDKTLITLSTVNWESFI